MKKLALIVLIIAAVFSSCKKEDKDDDKKDDVFASITVPDKQEAFVLLTTATWCIYCGQWGIPTFDGAFDGAKQIDPARINGMALHYSSSDPMYLAMSKTLKDDYGIGGPPNLWIEFNNSYNTNPTGWENAVKARQNEPGPKAGIGMSKKEEGSTITINARVKFFTSVSGNYNIAIYVAENGIKADQTGSSAGANHIHKMVLRGELTANAAYGTQMFNGASPEEYKKSFTYTPEPGIKAENLKFVAVIYEMNSGKPVKTLNSNTL